MGRYAVWIVAPKGDVHWQGLAHAADGVRYALAQLGHDVAFYNGDLHIPDLGRLVIFNSHRLGDQPIPDNAILFNAEQVQESGWMPDYVALLRKHIVWDYSRENVDRLRRLGCERVEHCPIGYWPGLSTIEPVVEETVDVLHIGSLNDRRKAILSAVASTGLTVKALFGVYGANRDAWIQRSKIVLNLHFYPNPIFEIFRVSHLLANKKCVLTEDGGSDPELESIARRGAVYVSTAKVAEACLTLARTPSLRADAAERGFYTISQISQVESVRKALG